MQTDTTPLAARLQRFPVSLKAGLAAGVVTASTAALAILVIVDSARDDWQNIDSHLLGAAGILLAGMALIVITVKSLTDPLAVLSQYAADLDLRASGPPGRGILSARDDEIGLIARHLEDFRDAAVAHCTAADMDRDTIEAILRSAPDAILVTDEHAVIERLNPATESVFGYAEKDLLGRSVDMLVPAPYRRNHPENVARHVARPTHEGGAKLIHEVQAQRQSGEVFPAHVAINRFRVGDRVKFAVIARDLTQQHRSEALNLRLGRILDRTVSEIYVFYRDDFRIVQMNRTARHNLGVTVADLDSIRPVDFIDGLNMAAFLDLLRPIHDGAPDPVWHRLSHRRADGTVYPVEYCFQLIHAEHPPVITAIGHDITEKLDAERRLYEQASLLQNILDSVPAGIFWKSAEGIWRGCNPQFARDLGLDGPDRLVGRHTLELQEAIGSAAIEMNDRDRAVVETGRPLLHYRQEIRHANGETFVYRVNKAPIFDQSGAVSGILGTYLDITEDMRNVQTLEDSERLFRAILETAGDAILLYDGHGSIRDANRKAEEMFGYDKTTLLARRIQDIDDDPDTVLSAAVGCDGRVLMAPVTLERTFRTADDRPLPVEIAISHVRREDECLTVALIRDISLRIRTQRALRDAKEAAEAASRTKSAFLASISHELRTPLNAIILYSEMLQEDAELDGAAQTVEEMGKIRAAGTHLLALINDILDISKVEAGQMQVLPEMFAVADLIGELRDLALPLMARNTNRLTIDCPPDTGLMTSDRLKLRQMLLNLLSNAAKFTTDGDIRLTVRRTGANAAATLDFRVADTGIGMTGEQCRRVFELFAQATPGTHAEYGGTGLGLPLTRMLARLLGGEISVTSTLGEGSVFSIAIPAAWPQAAPVKTAEPAAGEPSPPRTVMLIDDDPEIAEALALALQPHNCRLVTVTEPEHAVARARRIRPALILLDVLMPVCDGWDVLARLKADPRCRTIPVVVMTVLGDREIGMALGACGFIRKPFAIEAGVRRALHCLTCPITMDVMVIDDDADARNGLCRLLEKAGIPARAAASGMKAIDDMRRVQPAAVLLDLSMPHMDGFDVLDAMQDDPKLAKIPVLVITGIDLSATAIERLRRRTRAIFLKDRFTPAELTDLLKTLRPVACETAPPDDLAPSHAEQDADALTEKEPLL